MDEKQFWLLIDETRAEAGNDVDKHMETLKTKLSQYTFDELVAFGKLWQQYRVKAYHWPLWAAAYIIGGGCSDDGFMDFRDWLISKGQDRFETTLKDPDSLSELTEELQEHEGQVEGFSYIPQEIIEEKWPDQMDTFYELISSENISSGEPTGEAWNEDDEEQLEKLCPHLYEQFW